MIYNKLSPELVKDFWNYMSDLYDTTTVTKADSAFMKTVGWALNLMKIQDKTTFMNKYTTTIGKTIYVCFKVGDPVSKDLASQISICTHEHQHVVQYRKGGFDFKMEYLLQHDQRAKYEAQAYTTNMEIYYWYTGKILNSDSLANKLSAYGCDSKDIMVAKTILDTNARIIKRGGIIYEASQKAIDWLNDHTEGVKFEG